MALLEIILRWLWKTKLPFLFGKLKWNGLNQEVNNEKETLLQYTFFNGAKFVMLREPAGAQGQEHRDAEAAGEVVAENAGQDDQRSGKQ